MSDFNEQTIEEIQARAESVQCSVIEPKVNELQFDLDTPEAVQLFERFYKEQLEKFFKKEPIKRIQWSSKSGDGLHVVLTVPRDLSVPERIALQAIGGSDCDRELYSLFRHWNGSPYTCLLFKPWTRAELVAKRLLGEKTEVQEEEIIT